MIRLDNLPRIYIASLVCFFEFWAEALPHLIEN